MYVYLDNAATTKLHPRVLEKMLPFFKDEYGNASAIHLLGRKARVAIEESREVIAKFIGAEPSEIYFTSGGTESNNFIINGIAKSEFKESNRNHLITSKSEHPGVLHTYKNLEKEGFVINYIDVGHDFAPSIENINRNVSDTTSLISIMHVNNEIGNIFDLSLIKSKNVFIHSDAVQSLGKINVNINDLGIHALSASAHKLKGPKGIGFAYIKSGTPMDSFILGGGQERNRRAGTENVAAIVGFAEAIKIASEEMLINYEKVSALKNYLIEKLSDLGNSKVFINGGDNCSPYILSITLNPELYKNDSAAMLMYLDINKIAASSGSACASGTIKPSHVILAGGKTIDYANGTVRFSFSAENTFEELDYTFTIFQEMMKKMLI